MKLFRNLVYAYDVEGYKKASGNLFNSSKIQKLVQCFKELCEISESWAKCFRTEKLIRISNTNIYVEAQFLS